MLTVDEASREVLDRAWPLKPVATPAREALGLVLAEDVASDVDSPPYDKSLVDGYAVHATDLASGRAELRVLEEITAGDMPSETIVPGTAARIMTGAPLPAGADAVVMVEQTRWAGDRVTIEIDGLRSGQNIMRRATSMARGDVVLRAGTPLRAIELGVLAEVGRTEVRAVARPSVAILSTGNELVAPERVPEAGQIRNSNATLLAAAVETAGGNAVDLGIARDEKEALAAAVAPGLQHDVLLISGGVSAGVLDLVPGVLVGLGVEPVFHKVSLKPGKPLWFGTRVEADRTTLVFGLPGNPVSSLVCFELFVRAALRRLSGRADAGRVHGRAVLAADFVQRSQRATYVPARWTAVGQGAEVSLLRWRGSGDLRALTEANALAYFPPGPGEFAAGEVIDVLRFPEFS